MIEKFKKSEVFEVNYTNLNDLLTYDGSRVVKQSPIPLPSLCQPMKNATQLKRKRSWVEYNYKKAQRIKIAQAKIVKKAISTSEKRLNYIINLGETNDRQRPCGLCHIRGHTLNYCDKIFRLWK